MNTGEVIELEFLGLFSNTGHMTIHARFNQPDISIADQKLEACEIEKLLAADGKSFITEMRFDDHLGRIDKIDIRPSKNRIVLHVHSLVPEPSTSASYPDVLEQSVAP